MANARRVLPFVLLSSLLCLPGCFLVAVAAVGAAAAGAVSYENNEAVRDFKATMPVTWQATLRALRKLGYEVPAGVQPGVTEGTIESGKTKVIVEEHPGGYVRVRARVGTFDTDDNERRARLIIEEVTEQLPR